MTHGTLEDFLPRENLKRSPTVNPGRVPSGTIWPHGEWSLGYRAEAKDERLDDRQAIAVSARAEQRIREEWALAQFPLDLSDASNSHNRPSRGQKGITGFGQQMVKACGFIMGDRWPHHRKTLGTITLPPMSPEARREVVEHWPGLTRELLQWLSRRLERQGLPGVICSVTEVQPKRMQAHGEGCLHWHLLWLNAPARRGHWSVCPNELRAWLEGVLVRKITSYQGGHLNVDVKAVKGEAARYLAKYMSKGKQQVQEAMEDWGEGVCPRTWWNMTAKARKLVKRSTHKGEFPGEVLDRMLQAGWVKSPDVYFAFLRQVEMEYDGVTYTVGWRGRLKDEIRERLRPVLESFDIERFGTEQ